MYNKIGDIIQFFIHIVFAQRTPPPLSTTVALKHTHFIQNDEFYLCSLMEKLEMLFRWNSTADIIGKDTKKLY